METLKVREQSHPSKLNINVASQETLMASDFLTLDRKRWLSDYVITSFTKSIISNDSNSNEKRFYEVDTQPVAMIGTQGEHLLMNWMNCLSLHDLDYLVLPVHFASHWSLCLFSNLFRFVLLLSV